MLNFDALVVGACMQAFGEPVIFQPRRGAPVPITAVFDENLKISTFVGGDEVVETKSMLGCQASQFPGTIPQQNDRFLIEGRLWRAIDVLTDGHGHISIHVGLASDQQVNITPIPPVTTP